MSDIKLYLNPQPEQVSLETGIGRVVAAQMKYLPGLGFKLTADPARADVIACHVNRPTGLQRVDVVHLHGLYFQDIPHLPYRTMHHEVNAMIAQSIREARAVTVPSEWVALPIWRDMRLFPSVIPHGIDLEDWSAGDNLGYALWNKNRASDVCDATPAWELARRGVDTMTTFAPYGRSDPNLRVIGSLEAAKMKTVISCADVYLATTMETFGIGTLEALACGVPVLGYDWGGTRDIVRHGVEGWLVEPGDIDGLMAGLDWIRENRKILSDAARVRAAEFTWQQAAKRYAMLYQDVLEERKTEKAGVSVVIPCYNYGRYLEACVKSVQAQAEPVDEIIIVNDGSPDDSLAVAQRLSETDRRIQVIDQPNSGVAAARNNGIRAASQPFIVCLDADDRLAPEYVGTCKRALVEDRSLGVAYTGLMVQGEGGEPIPSSWPPEFDWKIMATVSVPPSNCIPSAAMFRKSMWERAGGYKQVYAPAEDTEFWVRGLSVGFNARKVSNAGLFLYSAHSGSASRTKPYHAIDQWHPWMRDKKFPFAAPGVKKPFVQSYAMPVISVIVPVGPGHAQYLPAAIDSLLGQTFRGWEVVIVNDSGVEIPEETQRVYPFARFVETNQDRGSCGAGAARNIGIIASRAPLCLFLDADDYLDPTALEKMLEMFLSKDGRYIYTDWAAFQNGKVDIYRTDEYQAELWIERIAGDEPGINAVTVLMATEDARAVMFDEDMDSWEDRDFFANCAVRGIHGVRIPEPLLYYRIDTGSRRSEAFRQHERLASLLRKRYGPYAKGQKKMAACCGSTGQNAIIAAKRALGMAVPDEEGAVVNGNAVVRMEFIGSERGPVTYRGVEGSGRVYRGNAGNYRFADVHPADVTKMELTGKWQRVARVVAVAAPQQEKVEEKAAAPAVTEGELRRRAEENLMRAKAEAASLMEPETDMVTVETAAKTEAPVPARKKERPARK